MVEGFTESEARKFASRIVPDKDKVEQILRFNPGYEFDRPVHNVPILLSFLCLLVREDGINLSDRNISMGEIYFRMVRCLYKKFVIRKGIDFNNNSFTSAMTSLGELALNNLSSGNPLMQRRKIENEIGPDAFDYGLLIGHEDINKISFTGDVTADIYVTFPHRSILEFLGSWYFVISFCRNQTMDNVDVSKCIKNPLFFQFCLWFLDESNVMFPFPQRSVACAQLGKEVANLIDGETLALDDVFDIIFYSLNDKDGQALKMLQNIGGNLFKIKHLSLCLEDTYFPIGVLLKSLQLSVFADLRTISLGVEGRDTIVRGEVTPLLFISEWQENTSYLDITVGYIDIDSVPADVLDALKYHFQRLCDYNSSLHATRSDRTKPTTEMYPQLVRLILDESAVKPEDLSTLSKFNVEYPNLVLLDLSKNVDISGHLTNLFSYTQCFPSLQTLIIRGCELTTADLGCVVQAIGQSKLPQLKHLDISANNTDLRHCVQLFGRIPTLSTLVIQGCDTHHLSVIPVNIMYQSTLDLSACKLLISLSALLHNYFPRLSVLILRECYLGPKDLRFISLASSEGRLPQLRLLEFVRKLSCSFSICW